MASSVLLPPILCLRLFLLRRGLPLASCVSEVPALPLWPLSVSHLSSRAQKHVISEVMADMVIGLSGPSWRASHSSRMLFLNEAMALGSEQSII